MRGRAEEEALGDRETNGIGGIGRKFREKNFKLQIGIGGRRIPQIEIPGSDRRAFASLEILVVGERTSGVEQEQADGVARETVVAEKALEVGLLDTDLVMN